jgi:ABC-type transport system involved in multi-copper enzyme maturation permease subunit
MNFSTAALAIRWLIRDTFRQSVASRISWTMLIVSGVAIFFCLSVGISGEAPAPTMQPGYKPEWIPEREAKRLQGQVANSEEVRVIRGDLTLLFGAIKVPLGRGREQSVRQVQLVLARDVADTLGVLLALIWTAGFLPSFLEPASASVLLAKPVPRWSILTGKFLGVLVFLLLQAEIFVFGTWLALGIKTAVWEPEYLLCIPILWAHFAIFFSFSTLLAVWTRSTVTCVFGTILFWLLCWGMNYGHHAMLARTLENRATKLQPEHLTLLGAAPQAGLPSSVPWTGLAYVNQWDPGRPPPVTPASSVALEVGYWIMPKPADMGIILSDAIKAEDLVGQLSEYKVLRKHDALHFELSVLSSLLVMVVFLAIAGYEFVTTDY